MSRLVVGCSECGSEYDLDYGDGLCHQCAHILVKRLTAERDAAIVKAARMAEELAKLKAELGAATEVVDASIDCAAAQKCVESQQPRLVHATSRLQRTLAAYDAVKQSSE